MLEKTILKNNKMYKILNIKNVMKLTNNKIILRKLYFII